VASSLADGVKKAVQVLHSGAALNKLQELVEFTSPQEVQPAYGKDNDS
jgi:anthranilate phosphoribosyltransferase